MTEPRRWTIPICTECGKRITLDTGGRCRCGNRPRTYTEVEVVELSAYEEAIRERDEWEVNARAAIQAETKLRHDAEARAEHAEGELREAKAAFIEIFNESAGESSESPLKMNGRLLRIHIAARAALDRMEEE